MKSWQKKLLSYGLTSSISFLIAFLVLLLATDQGALYSFFWAVTASASATLIARLIYHLALKDFAPEMWQISAYWLLAIGGFIWSILAPTWDWATVSLCVTATGVVLALGTRFVPELAEERTKRSLWGTLRYKFVNDELGGNKNLNAPVCKVENGTALTVLECLAKGYKTEAKSGKAYISKVVEAAKEKK